MKPKVSVIVPAYNISKYILDALNSIKEQTYQNYEALIIDDGSLDETPSIVEEFCKANQQFKLLKKPNGGLSSARNYGIDHAKGQYIALLDGDDIYSKDKLANHVAHLDNDPSIGVVYSASQAIRDDGKATFFVLSGKPLYKDILTSLLCKNFIGHGSNGVFRHCLINEVGNFDESLPSSEDLDFWLRVASTKRWKFYRERKILSYYRVRPSGLSFNISRMRKCNERVISMALERSPKLVAPILPKAYAYMFRYLARLSLTSGNIPQAREYINKSLSHDRSIFIQDPRSLLTLISVLVSPLTTLTLRGILGSNSAAKP
ncbi:glycosyltransferase family 2 protein [Acaryochloris sp. CCMEE 5410]|uniref:glycosyltransferase family 2 protein n=1 Tax=Acaryochloris sp. CCMEE 5410 TaxID=310037 RepID=UPI0002485112|nr:glycosyltransferase family 2 protein [Acaryochloris sp. CCMEE 5410]KAI9130575.1 glycosyltransferase family 2 protein [Acaryochloris sp. CCMEE 5410]